MEGSETMNDVNVEQLDSMNAIEHFRKNYLDDLFEAQELFLELQIHKANIFLITLGSTPIGYFLVDKASTLLEYYVIHTYIDQVDRIFEEIIHAFSIKKALCKSFDHTFLSCCVGVQKQTKAIGILCREYEEQPLPHPTRDIVIRFAAQEDEQHIAAINEEIFDHEDEIREVIKKHNMFIFEHGSNIIGFGIFQQVIPGRPDYDIGMLVDRSYRRQGYGAYIIRYLVDYCKRHNYRPICGCAIENEASRRCLERVGYIARYRLLECTFT